MVTDLRLTLPLPPSVNHCYRRFTNSAGRRMNVMTKAGSSWTRDARIIAADAANRSGWTCPQREKVIVELVCFWPDARRRDVSNLDKVLLDALEGIAYDDDRHALPRWIDYRIDRSHPRLDVVCIRTGEDG